MRYRHPTIATVALIILAAALAAGCVHTQPGADPVLVNAEVDLKIATGQLQNLFAFDYKNAAMLDAEYPAWKGQVNALRVASAPILDAAKGVTDAYRSALALLRQLQVAPAPDAAAIAAQQQLLNTLATDLGTKITAAVESRQAGRRAARREEGRCLMSSNTPTDATPTPLRVDMTQVWLNLGLALLPLTISGPQAAFGAAMLQLVEAEIAQYKAAVLQTGEWTPEQVAAFDAEWAAMKASPEWQVRP